MARPLLLALVLAVALGTHAAGAAKAAPAAPAQQQRRLVLTLGDSLTGMGSKADFVDEASKGAGPGWVARLDTFSNGRGTQVVNLGRGGVNSATISAALPEALDLATKQQVVLATLWLGANDAALPEGIDGRKHLPVSVFRANVNKLSQQLLAAGVHSLVLMTPPPVWEAAPQAIPPGAKTLPRTFATSAKYAEAVREVAGTLARDFPGRVVLLDLWQLFLNSGRDWGTTLLGPDGLHLSRKGNDAVYAALLDLVA